MNLICSSHNLNMKFWNQSAEYNRNRLHASAESHAQGKYHVRMNGTKRWVFRDLPPSEGAAEWLFINSSGTPLFYWNRNKNTVVLIG